MTEVRFHYCGLRAPVHEVILIVLVLLEEHPVSPLPRRRLHSPVLFPPGRMTQANKIAGRNSFTHGSMTRKCPFPARKFTCDIATGSTSKGERPRFAPPGDPKLVRVPYICLKCALTLLRAWREHGVGSASFSSSTSLIWGALPL